MEPVNVIYARVSSAQQEEDGTIRTQLDSLFHDADTTAKYGDPREMRQYLDDGVSGSKKPLGMRPAGKQLLADAKAGEIGTVIVYKFNRLGRKAMDTEQAIQELISYGVTIYDAKNKELYHSNSASSKMLRSIVGIVAEFEVNNDAEAMRDGMERVAREGTWRPSMLRLGYDWGEVDAKGHKVEGSGLVVNEEEADLVRRIFAMRETKSQSQVARELNNEGERIPRKAPGLKALYGDSPRLFKHMDIHNITTAEIYTGWITWGRTTDMTGHQATPHTTFVPDLQIVPAEQFNRVQAIIAEAKRLPRKSVASEYIYSGLIRCPNCDGPTTGTSHRAKEYDNAMTPRYVCRAFHTYGRAGCQSWWTYEHNITKAVLPFIADLLENRMNLREHVEAEAKAMVLEDSEGKAQRLKGEFDAAQGVLQNVQRMMAIGGVMTIEEGKPFILDARETIERSQKQLRQLEQGRELRKDLAETVSTVIGDIAGSLERLDPKALQAVVRQVFDHFTIAKTGRGRHMKASISSYTFRPEIQSLLFPQHTLEQLRP